MTTESIEEPDPDTQARKKLHQWYNVLVDETDLTEHSFQLVQGRARPVLDDDGVWSLMDTVPPKAVSHNFEQTATSLFTTYKDLLSQLKIPDDEQLENALGHEKYDAWLDYRAEHAESYIDDPTDTFQMWAIKHRVPQSTIRQCLNIMDQEALEGPVGSAVTALTDYINAHEQTNPPKFTRTFDDLDDALDDASGYEISFDSKTASEDVSHTWAQGSAAIDIAKFIELEGEVTTDSLSEKLYQSHVTVEADFDHFTSFHTRPADWYHADALATAFQTWEDPDAVWKESARPGLFFGDHGTLQYFVSEIVVAKGFDATVTAKVSLEEHEKKKIEGHGEASLKIWPFLSLGTDADVSYETETNLEKSGEASFHLHADDDAVQLLGVNVLPVRKFI